MITGKAIADCRVKGQLTLKGHLMTVPDEYKHLVEVEVVEGEIEEAIVAKINKPKRVAKKKSKK